MDIKQYEVTAFVVTTTIVGLLALVRLLVIELMEMTETMMDYILHFHHHVKRFRSAYQQRREEEKNRVHSIR